MDQAPAPELERIAREAYAIFRGAQLGDDKNNFPHHWDGLPKHYRQLLIYLIAHARMEFTEFHSR